MEFEPHKDFAAAQPHLGQQPEKLPRNGFGSKEKPLYINGPRDNTTVILTQLKQVCGEGNYDTFLMAGPPS